MIISILNQKGGVGKTTTAVNLGAALAATRRVLLVDFDAQANASALCGHRNAPETIFDVLFDSEATPIERIIKKTPVENFDLAPSHRALAGLESALRDVIGKELLLKEALSTLSGRYDVILVDNGPALGLAPAMSLVAADVALVPLQCEPLALEGLEQVSETISQAKKRLNPKLRRRILLTMLDGRTLHGKPLVEQARKLFGDEVFQTIICASAELKRGLMNPEAGGSILHYAPNSVSAKLFRDLAEELTWAEQKEALRAA